MAAPVLLISSDPFLGASLDAIARGRVRLARLDPSRRPAAWPGEPGAVVVLDVAARQRDAAYTWVRRHHPGPLVVVLKPGEADPALPPDPDRVVIGRPFRLGDLVALLEHVPGRSDPPPPDPGRPGEVAEVATGPATGAGGPGGRRRGRRVGGLLLLAAAVLVALAGVWLAFGLLEARQDLVFVTGAVRAELTRAEAALARGDPAAARTAVGAAGASLDAAAAVPERRALRVAARLPLLSGVVGDARHLLAAARELVGAGERAVAVATRLRAGRAGAEGGGRVDLGALDAAAGQARGLLVGLERGRAELERVRGGPLAPGASESRRWALDRLDQARARARSLLPTLAALPAALGADRPRTYLVVLTDLAAPGPSGGGPLAALELELDGGAVEVRAGGDELAERLEAAGVAADLPAAARRLLAAGPARPDGVVALDPQGARALLAATGPIDVPGWGRLDAAGAAPGLTRGGGVGRANRELLLGALLGRLLRGPDLVATGRVLGEAGSRGHLRVYTADAGLRRVLAHHRLDGAAGGPR